MLKKIFGAPVPDEGEGLGWLPGKCSFHQGGGRKRSREYQKGRLVTYERVGVRVVVQIDVRGESEVNILISRKSWPR